jgi:hypothetical protein
VTSGGPEDGKAGRYLADFTAARDLGGWRDVVTGREPQDDPAALLVRHVAEDRVFATVFGQLFESEPGGLSLECSRTPAVEDSWVRQRWGVNGRSLVRYPAAHD